MLSVKQNLISIIVPVFNEEGNIKEFFRAFKTCWEKMRTAYTYEVIFVNDGSTDRTEAEIRRLLKKNKTVKYLEFSRNFGKEIATSAGIMHCAGQAAIIIDADLQHPLEILPEFIKKWEMGADTVIGVRKKNQGESLVKRTGSLVFYKIMSSIVDIRFHHQATDYRLINRKMINAYNTFTERNRITRGLLDWLGFKQEFLYFNANPRYNGSASYNVPKLIQLSINSFVSLSLFPLKIAGYLGMFITFVSTILGTFMFFEKYVFNDPWNLQFTGTAQLAVINLFFVGIMLMCLGLIALYIANIHIEALNRPTFIIRSKENFSDEI
jgi:polyisoprenyl-phosphate glycosyltransferase